MSENENLCNICSQINRCHNNLFHQRMGEEIGFRYILYEANNFVSMPGLGSLVPGYIIVVPRLHVLSYGHLPNELDEELLKVIYELESRLRVIYHLAVVLFAHGTVSATQRGGSTGDHAHLHLVPVPPDVNLSIPMKRDFQVRQVEDMMKAFRYQVSAEKPFVFLRHHDGSMYICDALNAKSQYFRRELAYQLQLGETWDWKVYNGSEKIVTTISDFEYFDSSQRSGVVKNETRE